MISVALSRVQVANLNMLMLLVEAARSDATGACSRFGLNVDQVTFLGKLATQDVLLLVAHLGEECLFPPRADLIEVLSWPPALAASMLAVHPAAPRHVASPASAAGLSANG